MRPPWFESTASLLTNTCDMGAFLNNVTRHRTRLFIYFQYLLDGPRFAIGYTRQRLFQHRGDGRERDSAS